MRRFLIIFTIILTTVTGCDSSSKNEIVNSKTSRIKDTSNFDSQKYISFIKNLIEDSLNCNWIYLHPVHIKMNNTSNISTDSSTEIHPLPPPPPSILYYKFDSLSFNIHQFDSIKIFNDKSIYKKGKGDSLFNYYGKGIVVSLPYYHYTRNELLIDYEIIDWGWCGTGNYQTIIY